METRQAVILAYRLPEAKAKLEKLNRRAVKLGIPTIKYSVVGMVERRDVQITDIPGFELPIGMTRRYAIIEYTTNSVVVDGYSPVATLTFEHGTPIIYEWPDQELPRGYYSTKPYCDHCGMARRRKRVFVLQGSEGAYVQVGTGCVQDYIGQDGDKILQQWRMLADWQEDMGSDDWDDVGGVPKRARRYPLEVVMAVTCRVVREYGWVSSTKSREMDLISTADRVRDQLDGMVPKGKVLQVEARDVEQAQEVVRTVKEVKESTSSYLNNIGTLARDGYFIPKEFNTAVSMVSFAMREWERQKASAEPAGLHIGEVGDRLNLTAKLALIKPLDGYYGVTYLTKWETEEGNWLTWMASSFPKIKGTGSEVGVGDMVSISGRVKAHGEFNGQLETRLTRCKLEAA